MGIFLNLCHDAKLSSCTIMFMLAFSHAGYIYIYSSFTTGRIRKLIYVTLIIGPFYVPFSLSCGPASVS